MPTLPKENDRERDRRGTRVSRCGSSISGPFAESTYQNHTWEKILLGGPAVGKKKE